jgi:hypothetical protein
LGRPNKQKEIERTLREIRLIDDLDYIDQSLTDPWFFLTGHPMGDKWEPGESNGMVWTLDEHSEKNPIRRFPNKEYLWWATKTWFENKKMITAKSRQIMISWLMIALRVWLFIKKKGFLGFLQNKKLDDSKEMMRRAKFIYNRLPAVIRQKRPMKMPESSVEMEISELNNRIRAIPQGADVLRMHTASDILSDETAFQDEAEDAFGAAKPTIDGGGAITMQSTSNRKNFFFRIWNDGENEEKAFEYSPMRGVGIRQNKNGFVAMRIHYSADPDKDPSTPLGAKWYEEARAGVTDEQWNREMEISFVAAGGRKVYSGFSRIVHTRELEYRSEKTLYRCWDFGHNHPAVLWAQLNDSDQLCILREHQGTDISIYDWAPQILALTEEKFPNAKIADFCDPAGAQKSDLSDFTRVDILRKEFKVRCRYQKIAIQTGLEWVRKLMKVRADGSPGILIDSRYCPILIEGIEGGYVMKKSDPDVPEEDDWYEHLQDVLRYILNNIFRKLGLHKGPEKKKSDAPRAEGRVLYGTGQRDKYTGY